MTRRVVGFQKGPEVRYVGQRIRELRTVRQMTQADVAAGQFTPAYISALERGLAAPSFASMLHLGRVLGVPPAFFIIGVENVPR